MSLDVAVGFHQGDLLLVGIFSFGCPSQVFAG